VGELRGRAPHRELGAPGEGRIRVTAAFDGHDGRVRVRPVAIASLVVVSLCLRTAFLSRGDVFTDEAGYAFRAIGMLDYMTSVDQTPLQWFDAGDGAPWWTKLSFHDHPPLVFLLQHLSMEIFGVSSWAFRLPSAILGTLSVLLVFAIGRELFGAATGVAAGWLLAVNANHVYISRMGLQESSVIFFMLLTWYGFLRGIRRPAWFVLMGAALGLGCLAKYTAAVAGVVVVAYALGWKREVLLKPAFWGGIALAVLLTTPVLVYNAMLYRAKGHFDLQLSFIFGQRPEVWTIAPGKEMGTFGERLYDFFPNLLAVTSWAFLGLVGWAVLVSAYRLARKREGLGASGAFLLVATAMLVATVLLAGPSYRFLSLLPCVLVLIVAGASAQLMRGQTAAHRRPGIVALLLIEAAFAYNSHIAVAASGRPYVAFAPGIRGEIENYGYRELDDYLDRELGGRLPETVVPLRQAFLARVQTAAVARALADGSRPASAVVIYDENLQGLAKLWVFARRAVYAGWPMFTIPQYSEWLRATRARDLLDGGFHTYYLVFPAGGTLLQSDERTGAGAQLEAALGARGIVPAVIRNGAGAEALRVFKYEQ
jgi:hypothetical protein